MPSVVAVIGAGNVGCALAAHLSLGGHEVRLCTRSEARLVPIREAGRIYLTGVLEGTASIAELTVSVDDAVRGADVVAITVPTPALPYYAPALAESATEEQLLWLDPGHSGGALFLAAEIRRRTGRRTTKLCQLSTASHGSRMSDATTVGVFKLSSASLAAFPGHAVDECLERVDALLPGQFSAAAHVLELDLANINAVMHPVQMICNANWIEATGGDFRVYLEGSGPGAAHVIEAVDAERLALAARLGVAARPFGHLLAQMGFSTVDAARSGSAYESLQAATAIHAVRAPATLDHRYLHEDVGWGLVPWMHLGTSCGVSTPTMTALTALAGAINGIDYGSDGLTLDKMGLSGMPADQIVRYVLDGSS